MPTLTTLAPYFMIAAGIPLAGLTIYAFGWMIAPYFMPPPGFDPMDGDEPRVRLSRDNPITAPSRSPDPDAAPKRSASGSNAVDVES